jgi:hypothetical protein
MSFGKIGETAKSLFVSSSCTHRLFPRSQRQFYVTLITPVCHILHIHVCLNTFRFSEYDYVETFRAFSRGTLILPYFPCILQVRRKNEESAEINFHSSHKIKIWYIVVVHFVSCLNLRLGCGFTQRCENTTTKRRRNRVGSSVF